MLTGGWRPTHGAGGQVGPSSGVARFGPPRLAAFKPSPDPLLRESSTVKVAPRPAPALAASSRSRSASAALRAVMSSS